MSWKIYLNLCSRKWLKPKRSLVINLIPIVSLIYYDIEKLLKNRTAKNEKTYKTYKNLFETIKNRFEKEIKKFYSEKLQKFRGDAKKTWSVMKKILGKCTTKSSTLPTKITVNKTDVFDTKNSWWIQ